MQRRVVLFLITLASGAAVPASAADPGVLPRGQYVVERVGMCADCHSPRDRSGQFIRSAWLHGAPVGVVPAHPMPEWAEAAPPLAGLPANYTETELAAFLETGLRPDGSMARPPMPPYRFDRDDARAVVEYLKSLAQQ
jgi:cytochrome c553